MNSPLSDFPAHLYRINQGYQETVPPAQETHRFVEEIIDFLFPFRTRLHLGETGLAARLETLELELEALLSPLKSRLEDQPRVICRAFMEKLPATFERMMKDADAFTRFDPAAECLEEVILSYPGFFSIATYRMAHELYRLRVPVLPRIMAEYAHGKTGVDIHPGAKIGEYFFIDHGTGTVIGETAVIGDHVKIYQGVTLGALFVEKSLAHQKRHPTIEDNVIIYARSTILGGETTIGHDSVIGGNVWLTESVAPFSVVYQKHHVVVKDSKAIADQINWVI